MATKKKTPKRRTPATRSVGRAILRKTVQRPMRGGLILLIPVDREPRPGARCVLTATKGAKLELGRIGTFDTFDGVRAHVRNVGPETEAGVTILIVEK